MTDLYDILKANRLKKESDPWLCILGEAWMSSEEDYKEYTGLVPYTFIGNGQPLISWMIKGNTVQSSTPTPTTDIVNEPLRKIGDYADSISDVISIPTVRGKNVFDVDTEVKPSEVYIKYKNR